ncbi:uncharacterized protein LOC129610590 [Condylostylus longicornis]|uniref:uncharacterized protein LOC129610590 n=1 Tax=Condylostylus longicornis TaxID=2530218 RepID=UPI00244DD3DE|nr:uncharacterized protein LOC129610590 [Condylostylus longicornis]
MFPNKFHLALLAFLGLGTERTSTDAEILEAMTISSSTSITNSEFSSSLQSLTLPTSPLPTKSVTNSDSIPIDDELNKISTENINETRLDAISIGINNSGGDSSVAIGVGNVSKRGGNFHNSSTNFNGGGNNMNNFTNKKYNVSNNRGGMRMTLNLITPPIYDPPTPPADVILPHSSSSFTRHSSYPTVVTLSSISSLSSLTSSSLLSTSKVKSLKQNKSAIDMNVTVQLGNNAYLPCNVEQLIDKPVSWIRVRDGHILTVDHTQFIADERFQPIYQEQHQRWSLQIKYSQKHDMGLYECQVATEPKRSSRVFLNVVVPKTELIGDHNRFVKAGSKVALHCIVRGSIEPPSYIIWFKGNQQIIQGNKQGWYMQIDREIFGNSSDQQNTIGSLIIPSVTKRDSGNYTCSPSNSAPVSVDLHVLNGEYSASAIMSAGVINRQHFATLFLAVVLTIFRLS